MKTRVWKYGSSYYPQYRKWFVWQFIYTGCDTAEVFSNKEDAIKYLEGNWQEYRKVVWKSE